MTFHPDAAICAYFLFPDGHNLFQAVDTVTSGIENPLIAVTGGAGNIRGHIANRQLANALHDGHTFTSGQRAQISWAI